MTQLSRLQLAVMSGLPGLLPVKQEA